MWMSRTCMKSFSVLATTSIPNATPYWLMGLSMRSTTPRPLKSLAGRWALMPPPRCPKRAILAHGLPISSWPPRSWTWLPNAGRNTASTCKIECRGDGLSSPCFEKLRTTFTSRSTRQHSRGDGLSSPCFPLSSPCFADMKRLSCTCCLCLLLLLALFLAACGGTNSPPTGTGPGNTPAASKEPTAISAVTVVTFIHEYPLPQSNGGLMRPAVDHEGRIWFGEMGRNYLAYFDPRTQAFQQMTPPHGHDGIMGVLVAPDDTIWFAEQYANYIGHYFPTTGQYQVYSLPMLTKPDPSDTAKTLTLAGAPNDLALDAHGNVWFTELNADSVGKLNPRTGFIQQYQ